MNEKIRKVSASFREKLEQIKKGWVFFFNYYEKKATPQIMHTMTGEKKKTDPTVNIRLRSDSDKLMHSYPIRCEGHPTNGNAKGEFKWYRMSNTKDVDPGNNFQVLVSTQIPVFHPTIEDSNSEIACQWVPDSNSVVSHQPSNFARIGPLTKDPTILTDAQTMLDTNTANFHIDMSNSGVDPMSKLLNGQFFFLIKKGGGGGGVEKLNHINNRVD
ncbi:hypothetical protein RFI_30663, partial [Reticulomyxa filosa]